MLVLIQAVNGQMLGIGRLAYSLGTHRQIPSLLSRLDSRTSTPYVTIAIASVLAFGLTLSGDVEFLAGIFAFGAMLAFTIAHLSIIVLRFREPDRPRAFRVPLSVKVGKGSIPIPSALGALLGAAAGATVIALHQGARIAGGIWMVGGIALYVIYRRSQGKPLTKRFTIPAEALKEAKELEYGWILVPVFGRELDDDIVGTAGRLAADEADEGEGGAVLEALYVVEIPMSSPLDARIPEEKVEQARKALARAKEVGEEYEGVEVATATGARALDRRVDRQRGQAPRGRGDRAGRRGAQPGPRRGGVRGPQPLRGALRGGDHPLRGREGHLQGDPHRPAGRRGRSGAPEGDRRDFLSANRRYSGGVFVLIVGCGRVGSSVAKSMLADGNEVSVLDENPEAIALAQPRAGRRAGRTWAAPSPWAPRSRSTRCWPRASRTRTPSWPPPTATTPTS